MQTGVRRFEDLQVWQKARKLAASIYTLTNQDPISKDFALRSQMRGAAISIASNIAEGFERNTDPQFIQFLFHARGSCGELRTQLYITLDNHNVDPHEVKALIVQAEEVSRMIHGLVRSLERKPLGP